ncbi:HTH-type transcriptional regulator DmlR [Shewanella sp. P1-14-1]|uniref:LysR family transcriptional regulator n=1 Tax=Shewanella sp. P1-14-1 TaxID=1723761 RepID=UPI0006D67DCC|nr:LysR family transcriptional regulator [Shewanella sp. P1-14-1]KPZ71810.1 HTH-type transcriptional regulator DmlR [Shewanella sp. P1-14-1]
MDRIDTMKAFLTVSREGSFTKAAEKLGTSNQLVSKYVSHLEEQLGVRLLNRTTRKVHLTEAGERCVQHVQHILESIQDMEGSMGQLKNEAQGLLRISAPVTFATKHLASLIRDFKQLNPAVGIDLQLNDRKVDVVEEGFDLALRIGQLKSSSLIAKRVAPVRLVMCASPDYLERHGTPEHPEQLIPEHLLSYSYMDYSQSESPLMNALKRSSKEESSGISCNNGDILVESAIAGEGYVFQPTFIVSDALKKGQLNVILKEFEPEPMALYAVYPHRKLIATKLSVFIEFLSNYYGNLPYWDDVF